MHRRMPEENTFSLTVSTYPFHYSLLSICAYLQVCEKNLYDKLSQPPKNNKIDDESETRAHIRMSIMLLENSKRVVMCGGVEKQFCNNIFHAYTIYTCRHRENLIFELMLCNTVGLKIYPRVFSHSTFISGEIFSSQVFFFCRDFIYSTRI